MNYITIMIVILLSGETVILQFNSAAECGAALLELDDLAKDYGESLEMAQCIETIAPATSFRPRVRPNILAGAI